MPNRYLCLKGHLWAYEDAARTRAADKMSCPTCGLRLYAEKQAMTIPIRSQHYFQDSIPVSNADVWRRNRSSCDGSLPVETLQPGEIEAVPGYQLLGILGRGGMGIVFRARQLSLKRQVALKMILTGRRARSSERARFQREAEAVAKLQHPNIVQIYEIGEQNNLPYFSLEFVNAGSLAQFLNNQPQAPKICARFVEILAQAMHYAHKRGIVHRDLKPANILLHLDESEIMKEGQLADTAIFRNLLSYVPKITDFGLAKHMEGEEGVFRHGAVLGTPSYMAPEQARGTSGEVGPSADVYALGAIFYEMLTGRPPFNGPTNDETAQLVLTAEPTPPTHFQPKIPKDLETICLVCLQKNPAHRYGSAEAVAEDIRRFLANEPILARRTHLPERVVKLASRYPMLTGTSAVAIIAISLLWWFWWDRAITFRAEKQQMFRAWQDSEEQLQEAMRTIDEMAAAAKPGDEALLKARDFYLHLCEQEGPPARLAIAHYRLAKIHDRLGDQAAAQSSYQEAVARWEKLARDWPTNPDFEPHMHESQKRLQAIKSSNQKHATDEVKN